MPATEQQAVILAHDPLRNGRVIAGPGTGKSWTAIELLTRLHMANRELKAGLLTFTRAATSELIKKAGTQGLDWLQPSTVHSFALRLLLSNADQSGIDVPLRIPDSWEAKTLIHKALAKRLRAQGFDVDSRLVSRLEREMAAQWESLDPHLEMLADIAPRLRNAYIGQWQEHRRRFGYMLLAEIPLRAGRLVQDFTPGLHGLSFLIVDEFQDLNRADIHLLCALGDMGVRILAIGDDDQSIYGFRMAAPQGLIDFPETFHPADDYPLTVSMRCGRAIIDAATSVIETAPQRIARPRLEALPEGERGVFAYLRFPSQTAEARGVASLIDCRLRKGVPANEIAVIVRSNVGTWADLLAPHLRALRIPVTDTDWVGRALGDPFLRRALAVAKLALDRTDSLAWWALLHLTNGISEEFIDYVESQTQPTERFGAALLRLSPGFDGFPPGRSRTNAARLVREQLAAVEALDVRGVPDLEDGWGGWLRGRVVAGDLSVEAIRLLAEVGRELPAGEGLASFLGQLEPVGRDIANQADAVRVMSMSASKGLTVNSALVMGVEAGIVPHPRAGVDEERRLLYVAMTRATSYCILTGARVRTGPTARHGRPNVNQPRGRSSLLADLPVGRWQDGPTFVAAAQAAAP